jgi:hypothetical protein
MFIIIYLRVLASIYNINENQKQNKIFVFINLYDLSINILNLKIIFIYL